MADQYHHGNLRQALIDAGIKIINENGEEALSLRKAAATKGGKVIVKSINASIRNVFMMTGFLNLFEIA